MKTKHHHLPRHLLAILCLLTSTLCPLTPAAPKTKSPKSPPKSAQKTSTLADSIVLPTQPTDTPAQIAAGLKSHDRALHIAGFWIRDPYITRGPDGTYYLTGTIPPNEETRAAGDDPTPGVRVWTSPDLITWKYYGKIYTPDLTDSKNKNIWAPELHWLPAQNRWALIHCPRENSRLVLGPIGEKTPKGPWTDAMPPAKLVPDKHDASILADTDGTIWLIWNSKMQIYTVAPLNKTLTDYAAKPVNITPAGKRTGKISGETTNRMGHEGPGILKFPDSKKYLWFGTAWSTDIGRRGSYNLYYATADNPTGPYGPRRFLGRFLGHGYPFQSPDGRWWCTAFTNADTPPLPKETIQTRDLSDAPYTINKGGTTIVPLDIKILPDGDIQIRPTDPAYATPGPDEAQKF